MSRGRTAWAVARPLVLATWAVAGIWVTYEWLKVSPWHHVMAVWVGGLAIAGYSVREIIRDVRRRVLFRRWLHLTEPAEWQAQRDAIREILPHLPPWYTPKYEAKVRP